MSQGDISSAAATEDAATGVKPKGLRPRPSVDRPGGGGRSGFGECRYSIAGSPERVSDEAATDVAACLISRDPKLLPAGAAEGGDDGGGGRPGPSSASVHVRPEGAEPFPLRGWQSVQSAARPERSRPRRLPS